MDIQQASKIILNKEKDQNGDLLKALRTVLDNSDKISNKVKVKVIDLLATLVEDSAKKTKIILNNQSKNKS